MDEIRGTPGSKKDNRTRQRVRPGQSRGAEIFECVTLSVLSGLLLWAGRVSGEATWLPFKGMRGGGRRGGSEGEHRCRTIEPL